MLSYLTLLLLRQSCVTSSASGISAVNKRNDY
jgi:hypothetical protein